MPRLQLDFYMRKGARQLESKQFSGMTVDINQSIGTLTGLASKLVLRCDDNSSRSVIVPDGNVQFELDHDHVRVSIVTPTQHVSYHHYYAVTAHCLTDELTGRTGTEQALHTLASPSVHSFTTKLAPTDVDLLVRIARLTPCRRFYPPHRKVMQQEDWDILPPLSQHPWFSTSVMAIFKRAQTLDLFLDEPTEPPAADILGDHHLVKRAGLLDAANRVHGIGAEQTDTKHDVDYKARDDVTGSIRESQVCRTAKLVDGWSTTLKGSSRLLRDIESWGRPLDSRKEHGLIPLGYHTRWLDPPEECLPGHWLTLHATLSSSTFETDRYSIMVFLSTLAFSQHAQQELVQTLLAFATVRNPPTFDPSKNACFELSHGYQPDRGTLTEVTNRYRRPYVSSPEVEASQAPHETIRDADERLRDQHQMAAKKHVGEFVNSIIGQWPQETVQFTVSNDLDI
jgi:hypothetical protein